MFRGHQPHIGSNHSSSISRERVSVHRYQGSLREGSFFLIPPAKLTEAFYISKIHVKEPSKSADNSPQGLSPAVLQIDGVWHTGIVMNNVEYYYGAGIQSAPAGTTPFGQPIKIVNLGYLYSSSPGYGKIKTHDLQLKGKANLLCFSECMLRLSLICPSRN